MAVRRRVKGAGQSDNANTRYFDPATEVQPDHLITGVGCSAVLDQLFYTIMDEGEAVLLAAP